MELLNIKQRFGIIGTSDAMERALDIALRVASTDLSVLITGESGVGKEFFPQIIHAYSARKHNKYIAVNCGAIPEGTIDSELFGHEKGAFTGAIDSRKGYFEEADGGTIFLDEVAELPLSTQVRLLRVLQTGEFIRVGSAKVQKTNVRVVAATNVRLQEAVSAGRFREDLYYRLNTVPIAVPPLRERVEDIYILFRKFASDIATQYRMPAITLEPSARIAIEQYAWPGNVRQLKNVAEQISAIEQQRNITADIIAKYLPTMPTSPTILNGGFAGNNNYGDEREILYRILFDMRNDISELKRMVAELSHGNIIPSTGHTRGGNEVFGLLPSSSSEIHEPSRTITDTTYSEDVTEITRSAPQTKEEMLREAIVAALKRSNGRRKEAAQSLFMSERTLYRRIKEFGIDEKDLS